MNKRWTIKKPGEEQKITHLSKELSVDKFIANLLVQRGIETFDEAKTFFRPELSHLHNPFLMADMDKAVSRVQLAIENGEKVLIYGDYDVDGTTAVSLVYSFFSAFHQQLDYYIPDRYTEGYGISNTGIDWAAENGFSLIIALDCGIKAVDKVDYASGKNIDFIICDHHRPGEVIPNAVAVLDPKRADCTYPYDELSGCGIGFKLCQAYAERHEFENGWVDKAIDLCAISIACDIVPITDENRVLAYYGLKSLNAKPRKGLVALLEAAQTKKPLTITDLVFIIGPRINAAGRLQHAKKAVELLISSDAEVAALAGKAIQQTNTERREIDQTITQEGLNMIEQQGLQNQKTTVLFNEKWHKGVIGIVASRLIETHYRPTIMLCESNGKATGSARSVRGFDVYNAINECRDLLEQFGGHKYAAGLTMPIENIPSFQKKFEEVVAASIPKELLVPEILIDAELQISDITQKFYRILNQFAPFGPQNMRPTFISKGVMDSGYSKQVGQEKDHLKLDIIQPGSTSKRISGIAFRMGGLYSKIATGEPFDIAYQIEENEWQGQVTLQLNVKEIRFPDATFGQ